MKMQENIINWFDNLDSELKSLAIDLNNYILTFNLTPKLRYKIPFYYGKSWVCYLNAKKNRIDLSFIRANEFSLDFEELDFKKRKTVASLSYFLDDSIDYILLNKIIDEALRVDQNVPYHPKK
jgi:hypothetical protein